MKVIYHKFRNHKIQNDTKILIIGTFNPDVRENDAEFFYGRSRNYLWKLLPLCFGYDDLKREPTKGKLRFINKMKIDFVDLIESVRIEDGQEGNYDDKYIDNHVTGWKDIITLIKDHSSIKKVVFTRRTFIGIQQIKTRIFEIKDFCDSNGIQFTFLVTPARFYSSKKLSEWISCF